MVELIAKRYGTAIYQLAEENNQLDVVSKELAFIKEVLEKEHDFVRILNHPKIVIEEKIRLVEAVFKGQISDNLLGLIVLTITKTRQMYLPDIIEYCQEAIDAHNNIQNATITSANVLNESQKEAFKRQLEKLTHKTILAEYFVDESLIGGAIIRIGDRILDNSIKGKLANMTKDLMES